MTTTRATRPDVNGVLAQLKDFQRDSVEYVFRRLYTDPDKVSRFLIADEVGLGKTLVARGVIAKAVDHLWDDVPRIDIVYICSNQAIAQQNINRLNITADRHFQLASRLTLLPIKLKGLEANKLNFVSLTPSTSFHLHSSTGRWYERVVLYYLLKGYLDVPAGELNNLLRGDVRRDRWREHLARFERDEVAKIDQDLKQAFRDALAANTGLRQQVGAVAAKIGGRRTRLPDEMRWERNAVVGQLRRVLARSCLSALEPDLVILDEFQRFRELLSDEGETALLARELFNFPSVRILLLSATPYKMYTCQGEEEDHYKDFCSTLSFLLGEQPGAFSELERALEHYRQAMFHLGSGGRKELLRAKDTITHTLRRVMVRTERLAASADRNGMLAETKIGQDLVSPGDLMAYVHLDRIARAVQADDQVEYWKSSAYPLNLMERYKLKQRFEAALEGPNRQEVRNLLREAQSTLLSWRSLAQYQPIDPGNARLRALCQETLETGNWRLLWMPACLPYYQPAGPFADVKPQGATKTLIFSAWRLAPKTIAMLLSYEAERQMVAGRGVEFSYDELTQKRSPLLTFTRSQGRLTGMPVFCLAYPCATLAAELDPLAISRELTDGTRPLPEEVLELARGRVRRVLSRAMRALAKKQGGRPDQDWYWASLALLDNRAHRTEVASWFADQHAGVAWSTLLDATRSDGSEPADEAEDSSRFAEHVEEFRQAFAGQGSLGPQPDDLVDVLARVALGSPAVVALRALLRLVEPHSEADWAECLAAAARIGLAFRSLFNSPDAISLLQSLYPEEPSKEPYWQKVLHYCLDGNLQATMDEYFHVLREALGLVGHDTAEFARKLSETVAGALALRTATLRFDEILPGAAKPLAKRGIRCHYALRYGSEADGAEYGGRSRDADVWVAFNSPFWPFVLATTSIGQEGLDFHQYCHRIVHWNLPSNPVDFEQREGRIHRYKGLAVRRNLAAVYGSAALEDDGERGDPWQWMFSQAVRDRSAGANDLVPFWLYPEDGDGTSAFRIERHIPVLPLSRELGRLSELKKALVAYRCVIGQPRQEELVELINARLAPDELRSLLDNVVVDLSPPPCDEA